MTAPTLARFPGGHVHVLNATGTAPICDPGLHLTPGGPWAPTAPHCPTCQAALVRDAARARTARRVRATVRALVWTVLALAVFGAPALADALVRAW